MGGMKRWMEEVESRGYGDVPEKNVCKDCIHEEAVKRFVSDNAVSNVCDYCGKEGSSPIAASLEDVVGLVVESIRAEWNSPEGSGTPYESKEGGWIIDPHTTEEVLFEEEFEAESEVFSDIVGVINQDCWLKDFANPNPEVEIQYYWDCFCREVKHKSRYVFFKLPCKVPV
ncbi:protein of unknown function [Pseudodesulfovibrio profundus]|uniref:HEPN/RES N-terminal domain-containing protein n=1 Tax=Pseudodesulfovibrio profundus TaxID=57320 RepID=A0A2C8F886_9BACT|nr:HEPN-associated N-terminal domain-containing protein [Pseudodesulfovibrio profundus]SOB58240.1 protein of unknown function [Pseudodesulfovibrio profundus]